MKTSELLIKAKALIQDERNWCKGEFSKTSETGECQYCVLGAIGTARDMVERESLEQTDDSAVWILGSAVDRITGSSAIAQFNDRTSTTHADVLRAFDIAIEIAQEEEGITVTNEPHEDSNH